MKRFISLIVGMLFVGLVFAQSPEKMSYQAVIRDANNDLVSNQPVGMRISILQGTTSGTHVYEEIFNPNPVTNVNGLLTIEIGGGIPVFGNFSSIDWSVGPYFIKTETDPTGGTDYTITGVSQLLSVPYALFAKMAENISGTITENDPVYVVSPAHAITATYITNWNIAYGWGNHATAGYLTSFTEVDPVFAAWDKDYMDLTNRPVNATPSVDGFMSSADKTKVDGLQNVNLTAGSGIAITGTYPNLTIAIGTSSAFTIGQSYGGGTIFFVTPDGQHGLIAETQDQSNNCTLYEAQNAISTPLNHSTNGKKYTDWRLPSKYELSLLYAQKTVVGGFANAYYWNSTEFDSGTSWIHHFGNGIATYDTKSTTYYVRSIRTF
ncbi:MAG: DUF1566 domain-containing protein [Bacteroidales bacterium]|jgi:hypothetical protein